MSDIEVAQMLYRALLAYRHAQRTIRNLKYVDADHEKCKQLWGNLHACEAEADFAIDVADEWFGGPDSRDGTLPPLQEMPR